MRVAHTLTQSDLDSIGIRDRRQQSRIVAAARRLAAAQAPLRQGAALRGASGGRDAAGRAGGGGAGPGLCAPRPRRGPQA